MKSSEGRQDRTQGRGRKGRKEEKGRKKRERKWRSAGSWGRKKEWGMRMKTGEEELSWGRSEGKSIKERGREKGGKEEEEGRKCGKQTARSQLNKITPNTSRGICTCRSWCWRGRELGSDAWYILQLLWNPCTYILSRLKKIRVLSVPKSWAPD